MKLPHLPLLVIAPLVLSISGCGPELPATVPVSGSVTLDGAPVEGATVNFLSEVGSFTASGKTDASGKYTLTTYIGANSAPGAVVGKHNVTIIKVETGSMQDQIGDPKEFMKKMAENPAITSDFKTKDLIPKKYSDPKTSGLAPVQVTESGPNEYAFPLTSK